MDLQYAVQQVDITSVRYRESQRFCAGDVEPISIEFIRAIAFERGLGGWNIFALDFDFGVIDGLVRRASIEIDREFVAVGHRHQFEVSAGAFEFWVFDSADCGFGAVAMIVAAMGKGRGWQSECAKCDEYIAKHLQALPGRTTSHVLKSDAAAIRN